MAAYTLLPLPAAGGTAMGLPRQYHEAASSFPDPPIVKLNRLAEASAMKFLSPHSLRRQRSNGATPSLGQFTAVSRELVP